mgnify:CR=1 FL=1
MSTKLLLDLIIVIISLSAIFISVYNFRKSIKVERKYKHIDSTILIETDKTLFEGYLKSFDYDREQLEKEGLTIEQLMYYCSLLNVRWIAIDRFKNFKSKSKKVSREIKKNGYDDTLKEALKNDKDYMIDEDCTLGKVLKKDDFHKAWKYISDIWCDDSPIKLMIEYTIEKHKNSK